MLGGSASRWQDSVFLGEYNLYSGFSGFKELIMATFSVMAIVLLVGGGFLVVGIVVGGIVVATSIRRK